MMTDTEKIEMVFEAVKDAAREWRKVGFPVTFDRTLYLDGVNVRVLIVAADLVGKKDTAELLAESQTNQTDSIGKG